MPVHTHRCKHTHNILHPAQSFCVVLSSCPIILCIIIPPRPRQTAHFFAFLLNHSIVYATQYQWVSMLGAQYVTIHLKLSYSWLKYFVHSSLSMNHFQGIYGGIGDALVICFYNSIHSHSPHYWRLTYDHEKLKNCPRQTAVTMCSLLCLFQHFLPSWSLTFDSHFGMSLPLPRKQVACRQVRLKTSFRTKKHQHTSIYH